MSELIKTWPWEPPWIRFVLFAPAILSLLLAISAYFYMGPMAAWFLCISIWGLLFAKLYSVVANKVVKAKERLAMHSGQMATGLIVIGKIHAPGAICLTQDTLFLSPILGQGLAIKVKDISSCELKSWLPGKKLFAKKALHIATFQGKGMAIAVEKSLAEKWYTQLSPGKNSNTE